MIHTSQRIDLSKSRLANGQTNGSVGSASDDLRFDDEISSRLVSGLLFLLESG